MPKKRHYTKYSKPQSTAPASLRSSAGNRDGHDGDHHNRSVNEILADLRRLNVKTASHQHPPSDVPQLAAPSVPPAIRQILQLPETPAPPPRRPVRVDPRGRRLPPGPPPPRSWLSRQAPQANGGAHAIGYIARSELPGAYRPERGSLIDILLRKIVLDWEFQRSWGMYYLYPLPSHLRMALVAYLGVWYEPGVSLADLRAIFLPPVADEGDDGSYSYGATSGLSPSQANQGITHLDLTGSLGRSLKLRELSELLFPAGPRRAAASNSLQDSWDAPEPSSITDSSCPSIPQPLLPGLTHLSLAVRPSSTASAISWKHLLSLAGHLPTLTHLSLAFWPEPALTPNAKLATVTGSPRGPVPYGGTSFYSHSLDDDWSEGVLVLRRLSKLLYGLEHLDLTGCGGWWAALARAADRDAVDWVAAWGKVETLVLRSGYDPPAAEDGDARRAYAEGIRTARGVERHVRAQRAGRGRRITVEADPEAG